MKLANTSRFLVLASSILATPGTVLATTYYWDNNGTTAGFGTAGGTWADPVLNQISTDSTGNAAPLASVSTLNTNGGTDTVNFGTATDGLAAGTITVSGTVKSGSMTFGSASGKITLSGGTINFTAAPLLTSTSAVTHAINSDIIGAGTSIQFTGTGGGAPTSGFFELGGTNTFAGQLIVGRTGSAKVTFSSASNLGSGTIIILGGNNGTVGALELANGSSAVNVSKNISIGSNTGTTTTSSGTILSNNTNALHTLSFGNATFNAAVAAAITATRTLTLGGSNTGNNTISGEIRNNGSTAAGVVNLVKADGGTWVLGGNNTYTGTTTVNAGKLIINGNSSVATGAVTVNGGTLGGIGTVGGATTVGASGTLAPGQSPGTLTFINTLSLAGLTIMEIDGMAGAGVTGGHDFVNLTGAGAAGVLTYGGSMTLDIGALFGAGTYSWNLFDFASEASTFTGITLADQYSGSLLDGDADGVWDLTSGTNTWTFTESTGVLGLTVVPEPRAALLGGIGMLFLLRRRRGAN